MNAAPIYTEPGNGEGGGGIYPTGGGGQIYPVGGGPVITPVNPVDPDEPIWVPDSPANVPASTTYAAGVNPAAGNVGAPTTNATLGGILEWVSQPGPLGLPLWVWIAGGILLLSSGGKK